MLMQYIFQSPGCAHPNRSALPNIQELTVRHSAPPEVSSHHRQLTSIPGIKRFTIPPSRKRREPATPKNTYPGCSTIRYNRRNNPDLEKRRTHYCDVPGWCFGDSLVLFVMQIVCALFSFFMKKVDNWQTNS